MNLKKLFFRLDASIKLGLLLTAVLMSFSVTSRAADPTTPCDPEYMDALEAKAWMEAQREISQNQNFIFKPDSVLEYTCFPGFLNEAAHNFAGHRQFSETDRWNGFPDDFSANSTDVALTEVVLKPVASYLTKNFNTTGNMGAYLNNRTDVEYKPVPSSVNGDEAYNCDQMQQVWLAARCMNFNEKPQNEYDGFFDFPYYSQTDPRQEKPTWNGMCTQVDKRWNEAITAAFNGDEKLFTLDAGGENKPAEGNGTPYEEDDIVTHLDDILPGDCKGKPIPTGVSVERPDIKNNQKYDEMVCPNPGCTNEPGTQKCNL